MISDQQTIAQPHPTERELQSFLEESLNAGECELLSEHLEACQHCQSRIDEFVGASFQVSKHVVANRSNKSTHKFSNAKTKAKDQANADCSIEHQEIDLRFVIIGELARGGMGTVYRGFDRDFKREVAIKIAHASCGGDADIRFFREAQIAGQLQHPGIVPVHHSGRLADGRQYMAMKLVKGKTLANVIDGSNSQQRSELFPAFRDICNTMAYAHARNIIHRDLKPENVMVGAFGEVQIMDWGLARKLNPNLNPGLNPNLISNGEMETTVKQATVKQATVKQSRHSDSFDSKEPSKQPKQLPGSTGHGDVLGTPAYMSPEQARGDRSDKRTDVFALGGILFEILTGRPPFDSPTVSVALQRSIDHDLTGAFGRLENSGADTELVSLAKSCLAANPDDRPADAQAVSRQFSDYLTGREQHFEATKLEKVRSDERLIAQQKRFRQLVVAGCIVLATVIASVMAGYMYLSERNARNAEQARIERLNLQRQNRFETQVRESLVAARTFQNQAATRPRHEQYVEMGLALKEIEKATPVINDAISPELRAEFEQLADHVRAEKMAVEKARQDYLAEAECRRLLDPLIEQSYYPLDLRLSVCEDLCDQFATVFETMNLRNGTITQENVFRLANSPYRETLIHGLIRWQAECFFRGNLPFEDSPPENELRLTSAWITRLLNYADPDPFRSEVRMGPFQPFSEELDSCVTRDEAVSSMLNVFTIIQRLETTDAPLGRRMKFIQETHTRHPTKFYANWFVQYFQTGRANRTETALVCNSLRPDNVAAMHALGKALLEDGEFFRAIEILEKLTHFAPDYSVGHELLANAYELAGETENAADCREQAQEGMAITTVKLERMRQTFLGQNKEAAAKMTTNLINSITQPTVWIKREVSLDDVPPEQFARQRQLEDSISELLIDIRKEPTAEGVDTLRKKYVDLLKLVGSWRPELRNQVVDRAVMELKLLAEIPTIKLDALMTIAVLYSRTERWREYVAIRLRTAKDFPDRKNSYSLVGAAFQLLFEHQIRNRQPRASEQTVQWGISEMQTLSESATRNLSSPHENLAVFCFKHRRYEQAVQALKRGIIADPNDKNLPRRLAQVSVFLAKQYADQKRYAEALPLLNNAIDTFSKWAIEEPESVGARVQVSFAYHHRALLRNSPEPLGINAESDLKNALKHYRSARDLRSDQFKFLLRYGGAALDLAVVLQDEYRHTDAIKLLTETIEFLTTADESATFGSEIYARLQERVSQLYELNGEFDLAVNVIDVLLKQYPGDQILIDRRASLQQKKKRAFSKNRDREF